MVDPKVKFLRLPPDPNPPADPADLWRNAEHMYLNFAWHLHEKVERAFEGGVESFGGGGGALCCAHRFSFFY